MPPGRLALVVPASPAAETARGHNLHTIPHAAGRHARGRCAQHATPLHARLADRVPTLAAWKDGQGDVRKYQRIMNYNRDRLAWFGGLGDDCVPGYFSIGVQAYTSSISNIAPQLSLDLADAGMKPDFTRLNRLMERYVHPLYAIRERARGYEVAVMKAAMEILGMPAGPVRPPLMNCREADLKDLRKLMELFQEVRPAPVSRP